MKQAIANNGIKGVVFKCRVKNIFPLKNQPGRAGGVTLNQVCVISLCRLYHCVRVIKPYSRDQVASFPAAQCHRVGSTLEPEGSPDKADSIQVISCLFLLLFSVFFLTTYLLATSAERHEVAVYRGLFQILHLLAQLIDQHLQLYRRPGNILMDGFRAQGIGFAIKLLQ